MNGWDYFKKGVRILYEINTIKNDKRVFDKDNEIEISNKLKELDKKLFELKNELQKIEVDNMVVYEIMEHRNCDEHYSWGFFTTEENAKKYLKSKKWDNCENFKILTHQLSDK